MSTFAEILVKTYKSFTEMGLDIIKTARMDGFTVIKKIQNVLRVWLKRELFVATKVGYPRLELGAQPKLTVNLRCFLE